jgi:hypothetical protein
MNHDIMPPLKRFEEIRAAVRRLGVVLVDPEHRIRWPYAHPPLNDAELLADAEYLVQLLDPENLSPHRPCGCRRCCDDRRPVERRDLELSPAREAPPVASRAQHYLMSKVLRRQDS